MKESVQLLTVKQVSEILRLKPDTVRKKIRAGELQAIQLGSGRSSHLRIDQAVLTEYIGTHGK